MAIARLPVMMRARRVRQEASTWDCACAVVTGGMPEPKPEYVSLSLGKAGVRALVPLLDERYGPAGVHVATA